MTGRYKAYPEYKDSGVNWLEKIPSHWKAIPLKLLVNTRKGVAFKSSDFSSAGTRVVKASDIKKLTINSSEVYLPHHFSSSYPNAVLRYGDIILSTVGSIPDVKNSAVGQIGIVPKQLDGALLNQNTVVFDSKPAYVDGSFLFKAIQMSGYRDHLDLNAHGTANQASLSISDMLDFYFAIPPIEEQQKIANFLDHETAKIDTLITKQEKLIELLKEKRQAVISHAVTKGLNPDASMKDSGVEWLGEVPEHWAVSKLKWKAQTTSGGTPSTSKYEVYYEGGDIPWIRTTDLNNGKLFATPVSITAKALEDTACSILPKYSVLLAMYGGAGSIGKHSLLMFEAAINQAVCGIYPSSSFEPEFLHYFYEFYRPFWMINAAGTRKDPNIGQDHIREAKIALPPKEEQRAIVAYVNKTLDLLNKLNYKAIEAIELAKERKTALISAAVTGKIDVRDWQPKGVQG
ncbi:hypothetical protein BA894_04805 [Vibrio natriegens]|uniref:restriction endonuclease subunit S n=1 Tax=Vibrio natriegens TaxID=691 RepID=UPI000803C5BD|nr:restriction endonuclease subunit S [Vibrio natriegens]ANQ25805.1 hypothetical protein BA894_04805 [Vibrio natriegens]